MTVEIQELQCGGPGTLIDCNYHASCLCLFCNEYRSWFVETKEITPEELLQLIERHRYIIKLKQH